ncbi:MAG: hypothetical protein U9M98_02265 [Patescibacteria group bacterium]|nr:hypothetical protein [Patescibacteria group bacterium]
MANYFFARTKRRVRAAFAKARFQGYLQKAHFLRLAGVCFLLACTLFSSSSPLVQSNEIEDGKGGEQSQSLVAGAKENSFEAAEPEWPKLRDDAPEFPTVSAKAVLVKDSKTGKTLYERNSTERIAPASLVKIMTALVGLDKYSLEDELVVSESCLSGLEGKAQMNLQAGERVKAGTLLYGLLLQSAADAACVLARDPENMLDDYRGNEQLFVENMNQKAWELGLRNTRFQNVIGVDEEEQYSTAADLLHLAQVAMENPIFRKIVGTKEINLHNAANPPTQWHYVQNTNELLVPELEVTGVKTGTTTNAGECLLVSWLWKIREIYAVLLGSEKDQRFAESRKIIDWVNSSFVANPSPR